MADLITDLPDGLHADVSAELYHARLPGLVSRTALTLFQRAPAVYKAWLDGASPEDDEKPDLLFGAALHCALLEPKVFARSYAVEPDFGDCRYKENKATRGAWRRENAGKALLSAEDDATISGMIRSIMAHPFAPKLLDGGDAEITALWRDEATGLRCKARADYYSPTLKLIVDVKTTRDGRERPFARSCANYGYHLQRAFYGDGFVAAGAPVEMFVFLAVEKKPPYLVKLHQLDLAALAKGRDEVRETMAQLAECIRADHFPGYDPSISTISLPPWAA